MIAINGRKDNGIGIRNRSDGGEGPSGMIHSGNKTENVSIKTR